MGFFVWENEKSLSRVYPGAKKEPSSCLLDGSKDPYRLLELAPRKG